MGKPANTKKESLFRQITPPELKKGELRKLEIVEATISCLAKQGWIRTNYETVGQACNMKRPHVAYHYPVWDDLISAALRFVYATGQAVVTDYLRDAEGAKDQLRAYIEGNLNWFVTHPDHAATLTLLLHLSTFDKKYRAFNTEMRLVGIERVDAILNPGKALDKGSARWKTAVLLHSLIVGRLVEFVTTDSGFSAEQIVDHTFREAWNIHRKES